MSNKWTAAAVLLLAVAQHLEAQTGGVFGSSVSSLDGDVLVGNGYGGGPVGLFASATGTIKRSFVNPNPDPYYGDSFGKALAGREGKVLIGAPSANVNAGNVYVFDASDGALVHTFTNPRYDISTWTGTYDHFGQSVTWVGGNVLVGSPGVPQQLNGSTGVVYCYAGETHELLLELHDPNPVGSWGRFGTSVGCLGSDILVGTNKGETYLFDGRTGDLLRTFTSPFASSHSVDFNTTVVGIDGMVLVGEMYTDHQAGAVHVFDGATGDLLRTLSDPAAGKSYASAFGNAIAAVGHNAVIGAWLDDSAPPGENGGAAYLIDITTGEVLQTFIYPSTGYYDHLGWAVAGVGDDVLVGKGNFGGAYLYDAQTGSLLQNFVPEPATLSLLALGGLAVIRRRRK